MQLTLEERERHAFITNSPDAPLLAEMCDAQWGGIDEMRHERDMAQREADEADEEVQKLNGELEVAADKIEALEAQIHESGVDLV